MEYVGLILNNGRYEFRIVTEIPTWEANEGEAVIYYHSTTRRLYVYIGGSWVYIGWDDDGMLLLGGIIDNDLDTGIFCEYYPDEDILRFVTGDTQGGVAGERMTINYQGLAMTAGLRMTFDDRDGDTYTMYNTSTAYLETWTDGSKRLEM